jgi:hypothetical protein
VKEDGGMGTRIGSRRLRQSDIIAAYLTAYQKNPRQDKFTAEHIGEPIWKAIHYRPNKKGIIDANKPPDSLIIYPIAPPGFMILKYFKAPFPNYKTYFKIRTFSEIIEAVKQQLADGEYRAFSPLSFTQFLERPKIMTILKNGDEQELMELTRFCIKTYPREAIADSRLHIGEILERSFYAHDAETRKRAEENIEKLMKPGIKHYGNRSVPSYLYLGGLFDYLYQLTLAVKEHEQKPNRSKPATWDDLTATEHYLIQKGALDELTWRKVHEIFPSFGSYRSIKNKHKQKELPLFKSPQKYSRNPAFSFLIFART